MPPYCPVKGEEEYMWQDSTAAVEDFVQGNKGQIAIGTNNNYDIG
jgi:hypothetical protein